MRNLCHIMRYAEDQIIDRLCYRDYQVRVYKAAARLAQGRVPLSGSRAEPWVVLVREAVAKRYVAGDYVERSPHERRGGIAPAGAGVEVGVRGCQAGVFHRSLPRTGGAGEWMTQIMRQVNVTALAPRIAGGTPALGLAVDTGSAWRR